MDTYNVVEVANELPVFKRVREVDHKPLKMDLISLKIDVFGIILNLLI